MKKILIYVLNAIIFAGLVSVLVYMAIPADASRYLSPYPEDAEKPAADKANEDAHAAFMASDTQKLLELGEANRAEPEFKYRFQQAMLFVEGKGVDKDFAKAASILKADDEQGSARFRTYAMLALLYDIGGFGLEADKGESGKYFEKAVESVELSDSCPHPFGACDKQSPQGFYSDAGDIYRGKPFCSVYTPYLQNKQLGWRFIQRGWDLGIPMNSNAFYWLGGVFKDKGDYKALAEALRRQYESGNLDLAEEHVRGLLFGIGVEKNEKLAFEAGKNTVDKLSKGHNLFIYETAYLLVMYKNGIGTAKDEKQYAHYLKLLKNDLELRAKDSDPKDKSNFYVGHASSLARLLFNGREKSGKPFPQDKELALEIAEFANYLTEKYAPNGGSEGLISFYEIAGMPEKVDELYKRYAARSPFFSGLHERYLEKKEAQKN